MERLRENVPREIRRIRVFLTLVSVLQDVLQWCLRAVRGSACQRRKRAKSER